MREEQKGKTDLWGMLHGEGERICERRPLNTEDKVIV